MIADSIVEPSRPLTPTEELNLRMVSEVLQFWNTQDIEGLLEYYDDEIVWTNIAMEEEYRGKDEVRAYLRKLFTAIPDLTFDVTQKIAHGNDIAERWTIRGTHLGPFMGIPPTGKPLAIPGVGIVTMRDGKFFHDRFLLDTAAGLRQMGLLPPLSASETPIMRSMLWAAVNRKLVGSVIGVSVAAALAGRQLVRRA